MKKNRLLILIFAAMVMVTALVAVLDVRYIAEYIKNQAGGGNPATAYITIVDSKGEFQTAYEPITFRDVNKDKVLSVYDILYTAHRSKHPDGVDAFGAEETQYGLSLTKLWGEENNGSFGYFVNAEPAMDLAHKVENGDHVVAFCYTDTKQNSDRFCWFDINRAFVDDGKNVELTLSTYDMDENGDTVVVPVVGATLLFDGEKTAYKTDSNGYVEMPLSHPKKDHIISAVGDNELLVPPVVDIIIKPIPPDLTAMELWEAILPLELNYFALVVCVVCFGALVVSIVIQKKKAKSEK